MSQTSELFNRWELKYIISIKQMTRIIEALENYVMIDQNGANGIYKIQSLYYDTHDFLFYREKKDGQKHRQKVRIRGYGSVQFGDHVFFEIKQRYNATVQKRRIPIKLEDAYRLVKGEHTALEDTKDPEKKRVLNEIAYLVSLYTLEPKAIISYDRKAFMGRYEQDLRITFDTNLKCRSDVANLESKGNEKYFLHPGYAVLEIKATNQVPIWMISIIQRFALESNRVSKYCLSVDALYADQV